MESPSPPSNCINLCNNNLFPNEDTTPKAHIVHSEEVLNKINKPFRHPGQAIKVLSDVSGHTVTNQVSRTFSLDTADSRSHNKVQKTKSLIEYIFVERKTHALSDIEIFV